MSKKASQSLIKTADHVSIAKSKLPEPVIKGSIASPSAVAHIMTEKFVKGTPIYRQEQDFDRNGIQLSRQTMSNWVIRCIIIFHQTSLFAVAFHMLGEKWTKPLSQFPKINR